MPPTRPTLRLVQPPPDYSRLGETLVRLAELAAAVHAARASHGCAPVEPDAGPHLRLVGAGTGEEARS